MASTTQTASQAAIPPPPTEAERLIAVTLGEAHELDFKNTIFSKCRRHRFTLYRHLGDESRTCAFIGMNPSGADELRGDNTINKCTEFARRWQFGGFYMLNAHSLRATKPDELYVAELASLPENDEHILRVLRGASRVVVAWGRDGASFGRGRLVEQMVRANCDPSIVFCFGKNLDGTPTHPLYQPYSKQLVPYFEAAGTRKSHAS